MTILPGLASSSADYSASKSSAAIAHLCNLTAKNIQNKREIVAHYV